MKTDAITFAEAAGVFVVQTAAPAGTRLGQHAHAKDHLSVLACGTADVVIDGKAKRYTAPALLTIEASKGHEVCAVTDIVWLCLWGSDECMEADARESLKLLEG